MTREQERQIADYIARTPPAISGSGGHIRTIQVARALYNGFDCTESETLYWLQQFSKRCDPPWSDRELRHKVKGALDGEYNKPAGFMLNGHSKDNDKEEPIQADYAAAMRLYLRGFTCNESDLLDASPVKPGDDFQKDGALVLEHLFQSQEGVNFVTNFAINKRSDGTTKADPCDCGTTEERNTLIKHWRSTGVPSSDAGGWLRINPVRGGIEDVHVTAFRTILVEFDKIPIELQISFFGRFPLPIAAILSSGGKSVHAWIKVNAQTRAEYDQAFQSIQAHLSRFGMDNQNKNPARLSRLAGAVRKIGASGDGKQRLMYLNPDPKPESIFQ